VAGGKLYVYGGHTGRCSLLFNGGTNPIVSEFGLTAGKDAVWKTLATGPKLQGLAARPAGERVVRVGGFTALKRRGRGNKIFARKLPVAIYEPTKRCVDRSAPLPEPRSSLDAARHPTTRCMFVGGWGLVGKHDESVWYPTAWSWT